MNHRSLAELYEKRFAEQRREAATGRPPEPLPPPMAESLTRQIRDVDRLSRMGVLDHKDWLDEHVRAGNMQKCFDPEMGEHYEWIGPGGILPHQRAARVLADLAGRFRVSRACRWTCADVAWLYLAEIRGLRVSILRAEGGAD